MSAEEEVFSWWLNTTNVNITMINIGIKRTSSHETSHTSTSEILRVSSPLHKFWIIFSHENTMLLILPNWIFMLSNKVYWHQRTKKAHMSMLHQFRIIDSVYSIVSILLQLMSFIYLSYQKSILAWILMYFICQKNIGYSIGTYFVTQ